MKVDLKEDQLIGLTKYKVAVYSTQLGIVTTTHFLLPWKSCEGTNLLDVSGYSATGADGKRIFLLSDFIRDKFSYLHPANVLVTPMPITPSPCYTHQMSRALKLDPNSPSLFNDVEITVFTWNPTGTPAPNITFDWRCRSPYKEQEERFLRSLGPLSAIGSAGGSTRAAGCSGTPVAQSRRWRCGETREDASLIGSKSTPSPQRGSDEGDFGT